jgi:Xaa-Pro aminopeptidase
MNTQDKITSLRKHMKRTHIDAFIIPQADAWQSEHPEPCDQRFQYICGLNASAGYVVVTADKASVLIDGRYTVQAKNTVDTSIFDIEYYTDITPEKWAINNLNSGQIIGYDAWLHTKSQAKSMQKTCNDAGVILQAVRDNPVDTVWSNQPSPTSQTAIKHKIEFAGKTIDDKMHALCKKISSMGAHYSIISAPDSIAWLLNLRTIEDTQSPGVKCFSIVTPAKKNITIFTDVDCSAIDYNQTQNYEVDFLPLEDFPMAIHHLDTKGDIIIHIPDDAPDWLTEHLNAPTIDIVIKPDPITQLKSIKNDVEQDGIRASQKRDAHAMTHAIKKIKNASNITEKDCANILLKERKKNNLFRGVSFDTIAGWNANGAAIHGTPSDTIIDGDGLLLIDSGAQYADGTTDITRTISIGTPSQDMKEKYTLVLKAHIALATAIFPDGTTGTQIDALVRAPLWNAGIDFAHGTGHGVGHFLNVHEGPCGISPRSNEPLRAGMFLSNEPGYYKEGKFGIRLENLVLIQKHMDKNDPHNETGKDLLCFETVTHVAFEQTCIIRDMLTPVELAWLDNYHSMCG